MSFVNNLGAVSTFVPASTIEIDQPFRIDGTGGVAVSSDLIHRAVQHIMAIAFTLPGERVMRPTMGAGIQALVFENSDFGRFQAVAANLQAIYASSSSGYFVASVTVTESATAPGTFNFAVGFTVGQDPAIHQAVFDYKGNLVGSS